jgi:hypothetical protein
VGGRRVWSSAFALPVARPSVLPPPVPSLPMVTPVLSKGFVPPCCSPDAIPDDPVLRCCTLEDRLDFISFLRELPPDSIAEGRFRSAELGGGTSTQVHLCLRRPRQRLTFPLRMAGYLVEPHRVQHTVCRHSSLRAILSNFSPTPFEVDNVLCYRGGIHGSSSAEPGAWSCDRRLPHRRKLLGRRWLASGHARYRC